MKAKIISFDEVVERIKSRKCQKYLHYRHFE